ncbi:CRISPR-associated protein Cas5 [Corynebacterium mustelae]|uniref:CRISPR-associated protein Cas5 n=1 Tax=Corynebacterium mustelae TaxID=571915 RepID=A0A0G3H050_9CORY|nr:type I-E CRISPR-associated protein Cas5/CasD [Corynebacterium mustelae]AKK06789.1 CRISPR-associated protein Cas5 [Corynebacterium mustelae]
MSTLLLQLSGPLQAWGDSSRFAYRTTRREPTKSGVIGLLAAAQGRERTADLADLVGLRFGVRIDQVGRVIQDFQTEIDWRTGKSKPLTHRQYLADAKFVAALEGPSTVLDGIVESIKSPVFPLFLGRRSCPPSSPVFLSLQDGDLETELQSWPWIASDWYKRKQPKTIQLAISRDCKTGENPDEMIRDLPVCFEQRNRRHELRPVIHSFTQPFTNPLGNEDDPHNPYSLLGGV